MREARGNTEKLAQLKMKYDTASSTENFEKLMNWEGRWLRMQRLIEFTQPDVLTLQEVDRLADIQKVCAHGTHAARRTPHARRIWRRWGMRARSTARNTASSSGAPCVNMYLCLCTCLRSCVPAFMRVWPRACCKHWKNCLMAAQNRGYRMAYGLRPMA